MCLKPIIAYDTGKHTLKGKMAYFLDLNGESVKTKKGWRYFVGKNFKTPYIALPPYYSNGYLTKAVEVPCGHCIECARAKAQEWATRLYLECSQHNYYYFTTLTYSDLEYSPYRNFKRDLQLFLKRLRKITNEKIKYYAQFELGEHTHRGHFHILLFFDNEISDKLTWLKRNGTSNYYTSEIIQKTWQHGFDVTTKNYTADACINYVSAYCLKKIDEEGFHCQSQGIGEIGKNIQYDNKNYFLIHMKGQTKKVKIPDYIKDKIEEDGNEDYINELKEKSRKWIALKYLEPAKEDYGITDKNKLYEKKTENYLLNNRTKGKRRI